VESPQQVKALLEAMRRTPMRRGGRISERRLELRDAIAGAIEAEGVLTQLATRVACQLVLKFDERELGDRTTWRAVGEHLRRETACVKTHVKLIDRQIIVALPKLSADRINSFLEELKATDPTIARTVLNVALDAADPLSAGRRYLAEYHRVVEHLRTLDPHVARTLANATFMARVPHKKAMHHLKRFADVARTFRDDVGFARTVAKMAFRAPDPLKAAKNCIANYDAVVAELTSQRIEPDIARTLAGIASVSADPIPTAHKLLTHFEDVLSVVKRTHPSVARSIALSACRAADPLTTARSYMKNHDIIVRMISRTDPQRARKVATQAFRSDDPLRWAHRYMSKREATHRASGIGAINARNGTPPMLRPKRPDAGA
jgi:hypothetical protein